MQKYTDITEDQTLKESRQLLLDNDMTALTNQAGESEPTELVAGMSYFDTVNKVFKVYDGEKWRVVPFDINIGDYLPKSGGNITGSLTVGNTAVSLNGHTHNYAGSSSAGGKATSAAYADSAGSASTASYADTSHGLRSYNASGGSYGGSFIVRSRWNGSHFVLACDEGNQCRVAYATSSDGYIPGGRIWIG